jgi:hypothetical protein
MRSRIANRPIPTKTPDGDTKTRLPPLPTTGHLWHNSASRWPRSIPAPDRGLRCGPRHGRGDYRREGQLLRPRDRDPDHSLGSARPPYVRHRAEPWGQSRRFNCPAWAASVGDDGDHGPVAPGSSVPAAFPAMQTTRHPQLTYLRGLLP